MGGSNALDDLLPVREIDINGSKQNFVSKIDFASGFDTTTTTDPDSGAQTLHVSVPNVAGTAAGVGARPIAGSLVLATLAHPDWTRVAPSAAPIVQAQHNDDNAPYADSHALNPYANAPNPGYLAFRVVAPPGATSLTFTLRAKQYSGAATLALMIYDSTNVTQLAKTNPVLTASYASYTTTYASAVAGTEYIVRVACNDVGNGTSAQAQAEIDSISVSFNTSSDPVLGLATGFVRMHVEPRTLVDNVQPETDVTDRGYQQSAYAGFVFETSATSITIEAMSNLVTGYPNNSRLAVHVNGRPVITLLPPNNGSLYFQNVDLSAFPGNKRVEIRTASTLTTTGGHRASGSYYNGTILRAVYVPATVPARHVVDTTQGVRIYSFSDSIGVGFKATDNARGTPALLRRSVPGSIAFGGYGSQSLFDEYTIDSTFRSFWHRVSKYRPTHILYPGGHNDQSYGFWANRAAYETALGAWADEGIRQMPWLQLLFAPPILDAAEGLQAVGALCDYRGAHVRVAGGRPGNAKLLRSAGYVSAAGLNADGTHENDRGAEEWAAGFLSDMGWGPTRQIAWTPNQTWASGAAIVEAWEADQSNFTLNGFGIQSWPGLYNGHALAQATGSLQPLLVGPTTGQTGLGPQGQNAAKFYGGGAPNNGMALTSAFALAGPCSIYYVVYPNQAIGVLGSNDSLFDGYASQTAWLTNSTDHDLLLSSNANAQSTFDATQGAWQVITAQINGASSALATSNLFQRSSGLNTGAAPTLGGFCMGNESLGGGNAGTRSQAAYVLAAYIFSGIHTETERNQFIEGYIRAKWGF